jgi:hypothetical protein
VFQGETRPERLGFDDLKTRVGRYLIDAQIRSVIARRDAILALARERIDLDREQYVIYK